MSELLELARSIAREAGGIARARFLEPRTIRTKTSEIDLVTDVDHALDRLIRERVRAARPHAALLTEESQAESGSSGVRWIVDPLDGTTNYAHAFPHFAISIGVEVDGARAAGVVYDPMRDELFEAECGRGARLNGAPVRVSGIAELRRALLATGFAYVACGRFDGYWELHLAPWDVAAGILLVQEAGGSVSDFDGGAPPASGARIAASNGRVHGAMLEVLNR